MRDVRHSGGCQCGAIRYALYAEPTNASICHCRMCQKALGNFFGPFAGVIESDFAWTRGTPKFYASSSKATRGFCAECGTPLSFAYNDSNKIDVSLGSLDNPSKIMPLEQIFHEERIAYIDKLFDLPKRMIEPEYKSALEEVKRSNTQHPDHDTQSWSGGEG